MVHSFCLFVLVALLIQGHQVVSSYSTANGARSLLGPAVRLAVRKQYGVSASILQARRRPGSTGPVGGKKGNDRTIKVGRNRVTLSATNVLIAANVVMFVLSWLNPRLQSRLMKNDRAIRYYGQNYRFLTSLFIHGNLQHVMMNSYSLYNIGPAVEHAFGTLRYVLTYLASGLFANFLTYSSGSSPLSLGASGCTFGLIGALATYSYRNKKVLGPNAEAMLSSLKQTMLINLLYGFSMQGIDNSAHIYGALSGAAAAFIIGPRLQRFERNGRRGVADRPLVSVKKIFSTFSEFFGNSIGANRGGPKKFYPKGRPNLTDD